MDRRVDLAMACALAAFGALLIYFTSQLNPWPTFYPIGKQGLPYAIGAFLLVVGLVLVGRRLRTWRAEVSNIVFEEGSEDEEGHPASALRAVAVAGATIAYAVTLPSAGFLIGTPVFIFFGLWVMRLRAPLVLVLAPLLFTVVVFAIFNNALSVPLPVGPLNDLLVSLGLIDEVR